mgnify:CR=1 FL=1
MSPPRSSARPAATGAPFPATADYVGTIPIASGTITLSIAVAADKAVTTTDGSGLVHTAGAFGEIDKEVTDREGIAAVMPVAKDGRFTAPVTDYEDMLVFDANGPIIDALKATTRGEQADSVSEGTILLRRESYEHSYPH